MDKKLSVKLCDIRSLLCIQNCTRSIISSVIPPREASTINLNMDKQQPVDSLAHERTRRNILKKLNMKEVSSSSDDEESSGKEESDTEDSDYSESMSIEDSDPLRETTTDDGESSSEEEGYTYGKRKIVTTSKKKGYKNGKQKIDTKSALSDYEKSIEAKRAERKAFLASLNIDEVKTGISEIVDAMKKKPKKNGKVPLPPPREKSKRLKNAELNFSEKTLMQKAVEDAKNKLRRDDELVPSKFSFKDTLIDGFQDFANHYGMQESNSFSKQKFLSYDIPSVKNMSLYKTKSFANISGRLHITTLTWCPSMENLVVATGFSSGKFNLWNVDSDSSSNFVKFHDNLISHMRFNPYDPVQLISSSSDGSLRCCDLVKCMSSQIFDLSNYGRATYFDFSSPSSYFVSFSSGHVAVIDSRTRGGYCASAYAGHENHITTLDCHPLNNNVFVTATRNKLKEHLKKKLKHHTSREISIWDSRNLRRPITDIFYHKSCVNSAFFSPVTGNSILTTSMDHTICIFDSTKLTKDITLQAKMDIFDSTMLTKDITLQAKMDHKNATPSCCHVQRATWLPNSDELFIAGSLEPHSMKRVEIFDKNMNVCHKIMNEYLNYTNCNVLHPMKPALVSCSSRKLFVFA